MKRPLPPFDQAKSLRLDSVILKLESNPKRPDRYWLLWQKRLAERTIPPFVPCKVEQLQLVEVLP